MIAVLVINHTTAAATLACVNAVLAEPATALRVYLLDNGSGEFDVAVLQSFARRHAHRVEFAASPSNLGFAAGMNRLLDLALADSAVDQVVLLNSDTQPTPGFLAAMQACLDPATHTDLVAARLLNPQSGGVDSLGITLYRSTLASNRKREDEVLLGPTGGCALLTRHLLEDLRRSHGEWFDESFFCYAEDTDLVLRARWLGYLPAYAGAALVYHSGSLSSGGPDNDFVLYHGIRNSLWWLAKDAPAGWLMRSLPYFIFLHCGIIVRHLRRGRAGVLWRLYRDAIRGLPAILEKRKRVTAARRVPTAQFRTWVEPHFYERDYLRAAWRELWTPRA